MKKMPTHVVHIVTLKSIGGVQTSFLPFFKMAKKESHFKHLIMSQHTIHPFFKELAEDHYNFKTSLINKLRLIYFIISKRYIVHFHNNIGSTAIDQLLRFLPSRNLIFHEYGTAWNAPKKKEVIYKRNELRASKIIACSEATRTVLFEHLNLDKNKIHVVHHTGLIDQLPNNKIERLSITFSVGFIGRLDTPKGVHIFINAAKNLPQHDFFIAGEGVLEDQLKLQAKGAKNIHFLGVQNPIEFISKIDLLIVPSLREPLGNIIIEAGHVKKAVIAANVDGIAEIIDHNINGILISPTEQLRLEKLPKTAVPVPQIVVNPELQKIETPKEIAVDTLCEKIDQLTKNKSKLKSIGEKLNKKINEKFTLEQYFQKVEIIYKTIN